MRLTMTLLSALGALALLTTTASAAVVCNEEGDCWKVKEKHKYPPNARVQIYEDNWTFTDANKYRWREAQPGPGYWSKGVWIGF